MGAIILADALASKAKLLSEVPLFSALARTELMRVASVAERMKAGPGEVLAEEGKPGRTFFVIEKGHASVVAGRRRVARLGPGDFFGEMALLDQGPRSASVVADEPMTVYTVEARDFGRLLEDVPFLTKKILRGVSNRLRAAEEAPSYVWNRL